MAALVCKVVSRCWLVGQELCKGFMRCCRRLGTLAAWLQHTDRSLTGQRAKRHVLVVCLPPQGSEICVDFSVYDDATVVNDLLMAPLLAFPGQSRSITT